VALCEINSLIVSIWRLYDRARQSCKTKKDKKIKERRNHRFRRPDRMLARPAKRFGRVGLANSKAGREG